MTPRVEVSVRRVSRSRSCFEKQWIEQTFVKRECMKFVPCESDRSRCACGRGRIRHESPAEPILRVAFPVEKWSVAQNTVTFPTDAYGTIEFQGGPHPTKAQYVRLSYDTPADQILTLLQQQWGLEHPKLLISVHGGIANFDLQPKLKRVCRLGLLKAAKTIGAWVFSGGTNTGVMKHVGDALGDTLVQSKNNIVTIGVAPWGAVHKNEDLLGHGVVTPYHAIASPRSNSVVLNSNHSYFLLVDDGTIGKFGGEIGLRKRLENSISQQRIQTTRTPWRGTKSHNTPVVCLVMEGGSNTIRTVLECVTDHPPTPVVVIDGSGRAADLLAFTHKYAQEDGTMSQVLRDQLLHTIETTFHYTPQHAEKLFVELMMCVRKRHLITVYRIGDQTEDIDQAILVALLKGKNTNAPDQLSLALAWNRVDIARSHVFVYGQDWPEGALDQAMMDALINDRVDFVKVLVENGVSMQRFLTIERLEDLYNLCLNRQKASPVKGMFASARQKLDSSSTLLYLLKEQRKHIPAGYSYTLMDIGQVVNSLMHGGYRSAYCRKKFRLLYATVMSSEDNQPSSLEAVVTPVDAAMCGNHFKYPYSDLMLWAILLRRYKMAIFMWEHGEEALAKALVAYKLYHHMAEEAEQVEIEEDVSKEITSHAKEFESLSMELLEHCYKTNDDLAQILLTYHLASWSDQTCLSLAVRAKHRPFLAQTCCQSLLSEMWMGGLRIRRYATLKVLLGIFFFPVILFLKYRSREELELMPQTFEEHLQELNDSDSDSCSDSDASSVTSRASAATSGTGKKRKSKKKGRSPAAEEQQEPQQPASSPNMSRNRLNSAGHIIFPANPDVGFRSSGKKGKLRFGSKIYEFYTAPITKFWLHTISFVVFLTAFIYFALGRTPDTPSGTEWYLLSYMIGYSMEKIREFLVSEPVRTAEKLHVFFTDLWNVLDAFILLLFFIGFGLRFQPDLVSYARAFYGLSVSLVVPRILDLFAVSPHLGPFVHIIGIMMIELIKFVIFLIIIMMSFGTFRQMLWFPDLDFYWDQVHRIFHKPYMMLYGEVFADEVWPDCTDEVEDPANDFKCVTGRWLVPVHQSIFLAIGILLIFSLLIAVFNRVFQQTAIISNLLWKFQRYSLVMEYENRPMLPPPLIVLSHLYLLAQYLRKKCVQMKVSRDNGLKLFLNDEELEQLHDFEEECMETYYRDKEDKFTGSTDQRIRVMNDRLESMTMRMEDARQREHSMRMSLHSIELRLSSLDLRLSSPSTTEHPISNSANAEYRRPSMIRRSSLIDNVSANGEGVAPPPAAPGGSEFIPPWQQYDESKLRSFTDYRRRSSSAVSAAITLSAASSAEAPEWHAASLYHQDLPSVASAARRRSSTVSEQCNLRRIREDGSGGGAWGIPRDETLDSRRVSNEERRSRTSKEDRQNATARFQFPRQRGAGAPGDAWAPVAIVPPKPSLLVSPYAPIITSKHHSEYSSITDDIDTSSANNYSPPGTPHPLDISREGALGWDGKGRVRGRHHVKPTRKKADERLIEAEASEHKVMERMVRARLRSLTEDDGSVNLVPSALDPNLDESRTDRYSPQEPTSDEEEPNEQLPSSEEDVKFEGACDSVAHQINKRRDGGEASEHKMVRARQRSLSEHDSSANLIASALEPNLDERPVGRELSQELEGDAVHQTKGPCSFKEDARFGEPRGHATRQMDKRGDGEDNGAFELQAVDTELVKELTSDSLSGGVERRATAMKGGHERGRGVRRASDEGETIFWSEDGESATSVI